MEQEFLFDFKKTTFPRFPRKTAEVVGSRSVNEFLTLDRVEIAGTVTEKLQELSDRYEMEIRVDQVVLLDVKFPDSVKPAFNEVNEAQQERERLINQARSEYNRVFPKACGEAARFAAVYRQDSAGRQDGGTRQK